MNKGGDCLASGATRCQFPPAGGSVSQEKWDEIFDGFDAEAYKNSPNPAQVKTKNKIEGVPTIDLPLLTVIAESSS
jgi:hypothetical protein